MLWVLCGLLVERKDKREQLGLNEKFHIRPTYVGNHVLLYGRKQSVFPFHCMVGPHFPLTMFLFAIIVAPVVYFYTNRKDVPEWMLAAITVTMVITTVSLLMAACSDPGIVYRGASLNPSGTSPAAVRDEADAEQGVVARNGVENTTTVGPNSYVAPEAPQEGIECVHCDLMRPRTRPPSLHCTMCDVCVLELDHHCPWVGKCIGRKTLRFFYAFASIVGVHLIGLVIILVAYIL